MKLTTGGNLNKYADNGTFEAAAAEWGIVLEQTEDSILYAEVTRDSEQVHSGNYSALVTGMAPLQVSNSHYALLLDMDANFNKELILTQDKSYVVKAKVYIPSLMPFANEGRLQITGLFGQNGVLYDIEENNYLMIQTAPRNVWNEISIQVKAKVTGEQYFKILVGIGASWGGGNGQVIETGRIWIDQFEVYELISDFESSADLTSHFHSKNFISKEVDGTPAKISDPTYSLTAEMFIEKTYKQNDGERVASQELTVDNGKARFYFDELVGDFLKPQLPPGNLSGFLEAEKIIKRAQVNFFESYGDPIETYPIGETFFFTAVMGGLQREVFPGFNYFTSFLPTKKKFLTWQPVCKKVTETQQEYLYFLLYQPEPSISLKVEIHFEDDSKEVYTVYTKNAPAVGDIYIIPAGFNQLDLFDIYNSMKIPVCYELFITGAGGVEISERRQYILEKKYQPLNRYFLFHNSLGGFDTLRTYGKSSLSMEINKSVIQKNLVDGYAVEEGELYVSDSSFNDVYEVSSGFISSQYLSYVREILISKAVYWVKDGVRLPIIIDVKSAKIRDDDDFQSFLRFKFRIAYDNRVLTTILNDSLQPCPVIEREKAWRVKADTVFCVQELQE